MCYNAAAATELNRQTRERENAMVYLYGSKPGNERMLVAIFDSEAQLLSYVRWATLQVRDDGSRKFEQGSVLSGYSQFDYDHVQPAGEPDVPHSPTPNML